MPPPRSSSALRSGVVDARGSPTAERGAEAARDDAAMIEMRAKRSIVSELLSERERRLSSARIVMSRGADLVQTNIQEGVNSGHKDFTPYAIASSVPSSNSSAHTSSLRLALLAHPCASYTASIAASLAEMAFMKRLSSSGSAPLLRPEAR